MGIRSALARQITKTVARVDGWANTFSGLGTSHDRAVQSKYFPDLVLDVDTCADLYCGDPLAALCADAYPEEALRLDPEFIGPDPLGLARMLDSVGFVEKLQMGLAFGSAMGTAIGILGIDDGGKLETPLRIKPGARLQYVDVFDRRALTVDTVVQKDSSPLAGEARTFYVTPSDGRAPFYVHRSRCLVFRGVQTPEREKAENGGWDHSVYDRIYSTLRNTNEGYLALGHMLGEASQSVFKIKGLFAAVLDPGGRERMAKRALMLDMFRSVARSVILDADPGAGESYERHAMSFAGIPDTVDRLVNMLAAVTRIPVTVLMGQAPAGLNATGDADLRSWYNRVQTYQARKVAPQYVRMLRALGISYEVKFKSLWEPTEKERAEVEKIEADTDAIYLDRQVVSPEDVARARFGKERSRIVVDLSALDVVVEPPASPELPAPGAAPALPEHAPKETQPIVLTPTTLESILKVNAALEAYGQPADPVDGELKIAELKAKQASLIATVATAESGTDPNAPPPAPEPAPAPGPAPAPEPPTSP